MSGKISVLQFTNTLVRGGVEEHILVLLRGLNRELFRLSFACPPQLAEQMRSDIPADVDLIELAPFSLFDGTSRRRFKHLLRSRSVQLLHSHMFQSSRVVSPIARMAGVPAIIETPHVRESWRTTWPKSSFIPDRIIGRFVDRFIAISYANAKYLSVEKKLPAAKIRVVQNSCNLSRLKPDSTANRNLREEFGISKSAPLALVVARLEPQKGHRFLLEALPEVVRRWPELRVVCIGDGVLKDELVRRTSGLGIAANVVFAGFQPNVPEWLAAADFSILPSLYEGLPLVAIESLASGRAMVATSVDGTPEVIEHERTGLLVPPSDPAALAKQISRLIEDRGLRERLASAGRSFVLQQFREERQIAETEQVYLDLCRDKLGEHDLPQILSVNDETKPKAGSLA